MSIRNEQSRAGHSLTSRSRQLENTDFATAASSPTFQKLAQEGLLLDGYYGLTHPSEPKSVDAASVMAFVRAV